MPSKSRISPPPSGIADISSFKWLKWFNDLAVMLGVVPLKLQAYSVTDLNSDNLSPSRWGASSPAEDAFSSLVFVYNESEGPTLAFSDGTNWRRVQDRAVVS